MYCDAYCQDFHSFDKQMFSGSVMMVIPMTDVHHILHVHKFID